MNRFQKWMFQKLLKKYCREIDQFDMVHVRDGNKSWYVTITMDVKHPRNYRTLK
jgi:hypothetical protein